MAGLLPWFKKRAVQAQDHQQPGITDGLQQVEPAN
jgi:hypothetical protein